MERGYVRMGMQPQRGGFRGLCAWRPLAGPCGRAAYGSRFEVAPLFFGTFFWGSKRKYIEGKAAEAVKVSMAISIKYSIRPK